MKVQRLMDAWEKGLSLENCVSLCLLNKSDLQNFSSRSSQDLQPGEFGRPELLFSVEEIKDCYLA